MRCENAQKSRSSIIDRRLTMGGVCVHTGTIPSKVLREAVHYLSGLRQRMFYRRGHVVKDRTMMSDLVLRSTVVMTREVGATIEYFRDTVLNYPTLAEAYKVAALDGLNKL
jgi:pyruvate/2-oxoglutarate dehydrogenase complex dihydrolipoamide dehydrogenase (E3) component